MEQTDLWDELTLKGTMFMTFLERWSASLIYSEGPKQSLNVARPISPMGKEEL